MSTDNGVSEKERYQRYLAGREWGLLKQQVTARSGGICERCKIMPSDAVHHLTYERKYNERLEDLQDTCEACHRFTHGLSDEDPASEFRIPATVTGIFESPQHVFVFFTRDDEAADDEVVWQFDKKYVDIMFLAMYGAKFLACDDDFKSRIPLKNLLGRKYLIKLTPDYETIPSTTVEGVRRDESRAAGMDHWHTYNTFLIGTYPLVDATRSPY